jgi:hypothetical protein
MVFQCFESHICLPQTLLGLNNIRVQLKADSQQLLMGQSSEILIHFLTVTHRQDELLAVKKIFFNGSSAL